MIAQLEPLLPLRNKAGYVAARNIRFLRDALTEFEQFRYDLIEKHGHHETDGEGKPTGRITVNEDSPSFGEFREKFDEIAGIEHEVDLMTLKYDDVVGVLSGKEIFDLDWMLED